MLIYEVKSTVPVIPGGYYKNKDFPVASFRVWAKVRGLDVKVVEDYQVPTNFPLTICMLIDSENQPVIYNTVDGNQRFPVVTINTIYVREDESVL